jgi:5-methylcytosine-specific restriction endonuclease McrA
MPQFELRRLDSYDDDSLLDELRRVAAIVTTPVLTQAAFDKHSKASASVIRNRFEGWHRALELAGLKERCSDTPEAKRILAHGRRTFTDEELLDALRSVAERLGATTVTMEQFNRHGVMNAETVRRRFGWHHALERAGLSISNLGKRYSSSEYFENLLAVWTRYGRQPTYGEMDRSPSKISAGAYEAKWHGWRNALKAFVGQVNSDIAEAKEDHDTTSTQDKLKADQCRPPSTAATSIPTRQVPGRRCLTLGLRYDVLRRDHFRCVICGASPASIVGCELHVDHIIAVARGGENILENLRTLCSNCNLGKGAKDEHAPTSV